MKKEDIAKQLLPGVVVGLVLGFVLTMLIGVNVEDEIPNYISGGMCCFVPTLLNCIVVLEMTAKHLKRNLPIGQAIIRTIPYALVALLFGFIFVAGVVTEVFGLDTRMISVLVTAIYEAILGVVVSTVAAFFALKKYESDVKYTRRK